MKKIIICILAVFMLAFTGCANNSTATNSESKEGKIKVVDDSGKTISLEKPAKKIISLYSAHTENLFALGLNDEIVGVGTSEAYPPEALKKKTYSYRDDAESIIGANPDLVLIRPFIQKSYPKFVEAIEKANIKVVSLYPEKFEDFDSYIGKLATLTGKEDNAKKLLDNFHKELKEIEEKTKGISPKVNVFFESVDKGCKTVTPDSMAARAIKIAGGINVASDAKAVSEGSSIAGYGAEKVLSKANDIDVYVAQNGAMNAGGNPHSIRIRKGFDKVKAVHNNKVYNINEKIISSANFRYIKGVKELARIFYPEVFDDIKDFNNEKQITREELSKMVVMAAHKGIYVPSSKSLRGKAKGHKYGGFSDVTVDNPLFDYIETAVQCSYIDASGEKFEPKANVTREELARLLYMFKDIKPNNNDVEISDLSSCKNSNIVKQIINNGLMELKGSKFNPNDKVTGAEVYKALTKIQKM